MSDIKYAEIQWLRIPVVVRGEEYWLASPQGKRVSRTMTRDEILAGPTQEYLERVNHCDPWKQWIERQQNSIGGARTRAELSPWQKKVGTWISSLRRRKEDAARPRKRQHRADRKSRATTWEESARLLWHQATSAYRYAMRSGWQGWAATAANNSNKRKGCYYAEEAIGTRADQGERPTPDDRTAGLQLRFDWSPPDSGDGVDRPQDACIEGR